MFLASILALLSGFHPIEQQLADNFLSLYARDLRFIGLPRYRDYLHFHRARILTTTIPLLPHPPPDNPDLAKAAFGISGARNNPASHRGRSSLSLNVFGNSFGRQRSRIKFDRIICRPREFVFGLLRHD